MERKLGKLESIDLRELWPDEARDFTPWLANEGLELLGDTIGADLGLVKAEVGVGPFSADILAQIEGEEDHKVVIENQLQRTDHDHLGKTITYAAGLGARTIIWIAGEFTDEHRQAIEWLNGNLESGVSFFALEIHAVKIGDSLPAPEFEIISSPNNWAKTVRESSQSEVSETKLSQKQFWQELVDYLRAKKSRLKMQTPSPQHWILIAVGRSGFALSLTINTVKNRVACEIYISTPQAKQAYDLLEAQKTEIEKAIGRTLDWQRLDGKKSSRIIAYHDGSIDNTSQREEIKAWMHQTAELFHGTFAPRIAELDLDSEESGGQ